jgi:hypothetical protein
MVKVTNSSGIELRGKVKDGIYQGFYGKTIRRLSNPIRRKKAGHAQLRIRQNFKNGAAYALSLSDSERSFLGGYAGSLKEKITWQNYAKLICMSPVTVLECTESHVKAKLLSEKTFTWSFENGLSDWVIDGFDEPPVISTDQAHSDNSSLMLGNRLELWYEPLGDSSIYLELPVIIKENGTLSFWYFMQSNDDIQFDWQDAYITDTAGNILETIFHTCSRESIWRKQVVDLAHYIGERMRLKFLVHQDGWGDATCMYIDDVLLESQELVDVYLSSLKLSIRHPAIKEIVIYDEVANPILRDTGLTNLESGIITTGINKIYRCEGLISYVGITTANGKVHKIIPKALS